MIMWIEFQAYLARSTNECIEKWCLKVLESCVPIHGPLSDAECQVLIRFINKC